MKEKIAICSVGDLMISDSPLYASVGVGSKYSEIRDKLFDNCKSAFNSSDIVIGNFETVVHTPVNKSLKENQMACSEGVMRDLSKAGFTILNLANNHCMQHGVEGFKNTRIACEKNGIQPIGIRDEKPYIKVIGNNKIAFMSLCIHLEWYEPENIIYEDRIGRILDNVKKLRINDPEIIIVVSVHWGDEFAAYPSNAQIALAHKLVDLGANIILGHHSHIYQGIEEYGSGLIDYSQGNFISDMVPEICRQTGILKIEIDHANNKKISYDFLPLMIGSDLIPISSEGGWFSDRQSQLVEALQGMSTDEKYWEDISANHRKAHNGFKKYFINNIKKYDAMISAKMIAEFVGRKLKRMVGTSTDGRISSMDPVIMEAILTE